MNRALRTALFVSLAVAPTAHPAAATPVTPGFSYQGQLIQNGVPANGSYSLSFSLWDAATGGSQIGVAEPITNVPVSNGLFTVALNLPSVSYPNGHFGSAAFNGEARWLEISICTDSTCSPMTTLTPRQQVLSVPYASWAPASGSSGPWLLNGSTVYYNGGNVGIGTSTPGKKLTVAGDMEIGTGAGDYHHLRIGGGNNSGFLWGSYPYIGDGIHMGYNFYADASGTPHIIAPDGQTSRVSMGYGYVALATGGTNQAPINRLTVTTGGNVGVGTDAPAVKLDVMGDIYLGATARYSALGAEENLKMVRGHVESNGSPSGCCYTVSHPSTGVYDITYSTPFSATPSVFVQCASGTVVGASIAGFGPGSTPTAYSVRILIANSGTLNWADDRFDFIAIGPR